MADDSSDGSDKDRNATTVRDMKGPVLSGDTMPDVVGVYAPPRPLPEVSQHRTVDLKSIRISDFADPRRALTERRLVSPPRPPKRRGVAWALAAAGTLVLAGVLWLLLRESAPAVTSPENDVAPRASLAPPVAGPATEPQRSLPDPVPARSNTASPEPPTPVIDASAFPPQKAPRPRESAKKRKDPWLE